MNDALFLCSCRRVVPFFWVDGESTVCIIVFYSTFPFAQQLSTLHVAAVAIFHDG
jgi:hypothetical protein